MLLVARRGAFLACGFVALRAVPALRLVVFLLAALRPAGALPVTFRLGGALALGFRLVGAFFAADFFAWGLPREAAPPPWLLPELFFREELAEPVFLG
ncbi:MAG: hypothetical protein VX913_13625 [Planctomycetota bacterium]|nr:hypothetical protein [Planctomycetota bacterium]